MIAKQQLINKIEFWITTIIYLLIITTICKNTVSHSVFEVYNFIKAKVPFSYFYNYFLPKFIITTSVFAAFLAINFIIIPRFYANQTVKSISYIAIIFVTLGIIFGITATHLKAYTIIEYSTLQKAYNNIFFREFYDALKIVLAIISYYIIKELLISRLPTLKIPEDQKRSLLTLFLCTGSIWLIGFLFIEFSNSNKELIIFWTALTTSLLSTYIYCYYILLPNQKSYKIFQYHWKSFVFYLIACVPITIILILISLIVNKDVNQSFFIFLVFSFPLNTLIIVPLAKIIYNFHNKTKQLIHNLQGKVVNTNANLQHLKAQINPHFLFNTLNSLYGTAIVENAQQTSTGIQKLGDMMRFMLHENTQDYISLNREIAYLKDYIDLQNLRLNEESKNNVNIHIESSTTDLRIAPMLLIPFIENAYKFSISNTQLTQIQISLKTEDNTLFFDVMNSINPIAEQKKEKSGLGIENVKSRLEILYVDKHELVIHQTPYQYFVHLTINLEA